MEILVISIVAFFASILTFFAGFGLGTILLPVFTLFFPVELAVALTGVVHLLNNIFKMTLVGRSADWKVVLRFGLPAILGAVVGAWLLVTLASDVILHEYTIGRRLCQITPIKLVIALLMAAFALLEMWPRFRKLEFGTEKLPFGGLLSGFFGGLSGHQGALRSAFLIKCGLSKEAYIATGVMIASIIDISRISVYLTGSNQLHLTEYIHILIPAVLAAFVGAVIGKLALKKITIDIIHHIVMWLILLLAILLGAGVL